MSNSTEEGDVWEEEQNKSDVGKGEHVFGQWVREYIKAGGWDASQVFEVYKFDCEGLSHDLDGLLGFGEEVFPGIFLIKFL